MVIYILFAIGSGMLIISGYIDLSPVYRRVCRNILGSLLGSGMPWYISAVLTIATGALFGLFNAFLVDVLGSGVHRHARDGLVYRQGYAMMSPTARFWATDPL